MTPFPVLFSKFLKKTTKFFQKPVKKSRRPSALCSQGKYHDLKLLFEELNAQYFNNSITNLPIGWFGKGKTSSRSVLRLGYYHLQKQFIKINRILDAPEIPLYFVRFIVYHEMLHHVFPPIIVKGSKRKIHHPSFKEEEKRFEAYDQSQLFMKQFTKKTFASSRTF